MVVQELGKSWVDEFRVPTEKLRSVYAQIISPDLPRSRYKIEQEPTETGSHENVTLIPA